MHSLRFDQMATMVPLLAVSLFGTAVQGHMIMANPVPYGYQTIDNSPLTGSNYPCKVTSDPATFYSLDGIDNTYAAGSSQSLSFKGSAVHGGGSCQLALTNDMQPSASTDWRVILSIESGCPTTDGTTAATYNWTVPADLEPGQYSFAWTWISKLAGQPEYYMNCAPITVTAATTRRARAASARRALSSYPELFVANLDAINSCKTTPSTDPVYPDPGPNVEKLLAGGTPEFATITQSGCVPLSQTQGTAALPVATAGAGAGAASGSSGSDTSATASAVAGASSESSAAASASSSSATSATIPGGSFATATQAPEPSSTLATSTSATSSSSSSSQSLVVIPVTPTYPGNVTASTATAQSSSSAAPDASSTEASSSAAAAPTASSTSSGEASSMTASTAPSSTSAPSSSSSSSTATTSSAQPTVTGSGSGSNSTSGSGSGSSSSAKSGTCSQEGMFNCVGTKYQQCASGAWTSMQALPAGTTCTQGESTGLWARDGRLSLFRRGRRGSRMGLPMVVV